MEKQQDRSLCNAINFIHLQMVELARDCDNTVRDGLVTLQYVLQLQDRLEKILHETRAACSPPKRQPVMDDFEPLECLGGGSYGTVILVCHKETGQNLAMKMIRREKVQKNAAYMERDILYFTDNPFVVSLFCTFETETHLCMVMEYIGGGDCEKLLDSHAGLPVELARIYAAEIVLALEYIHSYGILHGDLKPANLLISSTGHIKLADFGLSKIGPVNMTVDQKDLKGMAKEFFDGDIFGTSFYMAPEMIHENYGKPVDWWALGIILYEFLVGTIPFYGATDKKTFDEVTNSDIDWSLEDPALPTDAQDIITRLLTKNCESRLGTGGASEVKAHPFFQGLDWNNLLDQEIPQLEEENEMTAQSICDDDLSSHESSSFSVVSSEVKECPIEFPDFCRVAFRFKEAYGSQEHLSLLNLQSAIPANHTVEEEQREDQEQGCEEEAHPSFQCPDSNDILSQEVPQPEDAEETAKSNSDDCPPGDKTPVDYKAYDNRCSDGSSDEDSARHDSPARVFPQISLQAMTRPLMTGLPMRNPPLAMNRPIMPGLLMGNPFAMNRPIMAVLHWPFANYE